MLVFNDKAITAAEIKESLEHGDAETKAAAMRKAITMLLAGEQLPQVRTPAFAAARDAGAAAPRPRPVCLLCARDALGVPWELAADWRGAPAGPARPPPLQLFITIVRYVLPSEDHTVQKLLLLYLVRPPGGTLGAGRDWVGQRPISVHAARHGPCPAWR